jgi:hypothetical protein
MKHAFDLLKQAGWDWFDDQALHWEQPSLTIPSSHLLLFICCCIASLIFGRRRKASLEQLRVLIGETSAAASKMVQSQFRPVTECSPRSLVPRPDYRCLGVFAQLRLRSMRLCVKSGSLTALGLIQIKFFPFGFILIVGFLLLISYSHSDHRVYRKWFGALSRVSKWIQILNAILLMRSYFALRNDFQVSA